MKNDKPRPIVKVDDNSPTPPPGAYLAATKTHDVVPPGDAEASANDGLFETPGEGYTIRPPDVTASSGIVYQPTTKLHGTIDRTGEPPRLADPTYVPITKIYGATLGPSAAASTGADSVGADSTGADSSGYRETSSSSTSSDADDPLEGTPFRLMHKLGEGGTGDVYAAEDMQKGEPVVVKLLAPELGPSFRDRMRLGADALRRLPHRHVVEILGFGRTPKGRTYIVMERLYGRTLHEEVRVRGPLPIGEAIKYTLHVLDGLSAAHARGLVHRDIKLENLFLCDTPEGKFIKILDFDFSKVLPDVETSQPIQPLIHPTDQGVFIGTARWAAPEQAQALDVDARTDLYAVGLVLLTMLSGRQPFPEIRRRGELLAAHVSREVELDFSARRESVSAEFETILRTALSKFPDARFATAKEFAAALSALRDSQAIVSNASFSACLGSGESGAFLSDPHDSSANSAAISASTTKRTSHRPGRIALLVLGALFASAIAFALLTTVATRWILR